jgi:hypothetical protein
MFFPEDGNESQILTSLTRPPNGHRGGQGTAMTHRQCAAVAEAHGEGCPGWGEGQADPPPTTSHRPRGQASHWPDLGGRPSKMRCLLGPGAHCRHFCQSRCPPYPWDHQCCLGHRDRPNPPYRPIESESGSIAADESIVHSPETGRVLQLVPPSRPWQRRQSALGTAATTPWTTARRHAEVPRG